MRPRLLALLALLLCVGAIALLAPWAETPPGPTGAATVRTQPERDGGPTLVAPPTRAPESGAPVEAVPGATTTSRPARVVVTILLPPGPPLVEAGQIVLTDVHGKKQRRALPSGGSVAFESVAPGALTVDTESPEVLVGESVEGAAKEGEEARLMLLLTRGRAIEGRVLAARDRSPLEGALVDVRGGGVFGGESSIGGRPSHGAVRTDAEGRFRTHALPLGTILTMHASARGHRRAHVPMRLDPDGARRPPIELLLEAGGRVVGVARDPDGAPTPGAVVTLGLERDTAWHENPFVNRYPDPDLEPLIHVRTDAEGAYLIEGLTLGEAYCVVAHGDPHALSAAACDLRPTVEAPEVRAEPRLRRHGRLRVHVVLPDGGAPAEGRVRVGPEWNDSLPLRGSEAVEVEGLVPGIHTVSVTVPGWLAMPQQVVVGDGETRDIVVRLAVGATISGRVVDDRGEPIEGASVTGIVGEGVVAPGGWATSAADGSFVMRGLASVTYAIEARVGERRSTTTPLLTAPSDGARLVIQRAGRVRVRVVLPEGAPAPARWHVGHWSSQRSGSQGEEAWGQGVIERVLPAGATRLFAGVSGFAPWVREFDLGPGQDLDLGDVLLERGAKLAGRVQDAVGKPIANASLEVETPFGSSSQADAEGAFTLAEVASGRQRVVAAAHGFVRGSVVLDVAGDRSDLRLTLHRGARLRVTLAGFDRARDADLRVHLVAFEDPESPGRWDWIEPDGTVVTSDLVQPGRYRVELLRGKQVVAETTADLADEKETRVEIAVPR